MGFPADERAQLLRIKGVGEGVVSRLEQLGFTSLHSLREADAREVVLRIAERTCSTCWKNSPKARAAIEDIIALAHAHSASS